MVGNFLYSSRILIFFSTDLTNFFASNNALKLTAALGSFANPVQDFAVSSIVLLYCESFHLALTIHLSISSGHIRGRSTLIFS